MRSFSRAFTGFLLAVFTAVSAPLYADDVELTLHDGRISLSATNATAAQIFSAWSRAGGVLIVNAEQMPATPLTLKLENVPEEQALETVLRPVTGYLARRRSDPAGDASVFDRIVIMATPAAPRPAGTSAPPPAANARPSGGIVFPQPPRFPPQPPAGVQQGPGVTRLLGPDGRPMEDDQADAPQYNPGDAPETRSPVVRPAPMPPPAQQQQPSQATPAPSAPVGVPRPGMVVPAPTAPGQQPGQQTQPAPPQEP